MFCAEPEYRWFDLKNGDVKWYKSVKPYCLNEPNKWEEILPLIAEDVKEIITKGGKDNLKGKTTKKKTTDKKKK